MGPLGAPELLIILAIVVVLFGATRIGDIGKGIGRGIKEFRRELKDVDEDKPGDDTKVVSSSSETSSEEKTTSHTH
ncbi:MAG TPA: twin-arginine translocase TatA/TatE family subunit [Dehalococcoidia bacterium]|nr:twin-arginine translocase TatA/TatE family subunit [Dehalococcoidia bacterium]